MTHDAPVARRQIHISNALGLHLRPAEKFVKLADRFTSEIRVLHKGQVIDAKSILGLAGLAAEQGTRLDLEACGPDAEVALDALVELVSQHFFEDDNGQPIDTLDPGSGSASPGMSHDEHPPGGHSNASARGPTP